MWGRGIEGPAHATRAEGRVTKASMTRAPSPQMTKDRAEQVANVLLTAAAIGAAYYVVRTPPLRRLAWRLAVTAITVSLPAWVGREVQNAWSETGHREI